MPHIISQLSELEPAEHDYKRLYNANPYDNIIPVSSWNDFKERYHRLATKEYAAFPDTPISDITTRFYEYQFFSPPAVPFNELTANQMNKLIYPPHMDSEIVAFKHLRYLPPFLHSLEFVKIVYVVSGRCFFYLKGRKRVIPEGSLIIVCPNVKQAFFATHDEDLIINVIMRRSTFENAFSPLLMESNQISDFFWQMLYVKNFSRVLLFRCDTDTEIKKLLLNLYAESQLERNTSLIIMNSYVLLLFGQLIRYHLKQVKSLTGDIHKHSIPLILRYIRNNRKTVNLSMLAQHFKLSKGYLSRYIKTETGYSFSALLQQLRMKEAANILRNTSISSDWHHLLEICALTHTLILDEEGLYDPSTFNDRLLLGLKGTMSEAELFVLRARLQGGILNKARRGALKLALPIGFCYTDGDVIALDPDLPTLISFDTLLFCR